MTIKPVSRDEIQDLKHIMEKSFLETYKHLNAAEDIDLYISQSFSENNLISEIENPYSYFYFIRHEGNIAGYLKLNIGEAQTAEKLENALEIERIYVLKKFQGKKLGKALFIFAEEQAKDKNLVWLWLGVWENNHKAIEFYERQGLEIFATHTFKMGNELQTDKLMRKATSIEACLNL